MMHNFREDKLDWDAIYEDLDQHGYGTLPPFLPRSVCELIRQTYDGNESSFRSTIKMDRYNYGVGEYKYFSYPLPNEIQFMREYFYKNLAPIANAWSKKLRLEQSWPSSHAELIRQCNAVGQHRPTPLHLRYEKSGFNCLHQDIYGTIHFPFQVIVLLSEPENEFSGGELVLVEQRPRQQSRAIIPRLKQGGAAIIPVQHRPQLGNRGYHRATMRHGVADITSGQRHALGIIFHDAK